LVGRQPYEIARLGIGYVPEDRRIFRSLTVHENLLMGIKGGEQENAGKGGWTLERVYTLFPRLEERRNQQGGILSGGEQQMLTIVRTLMGNPRVILIDEPTEGLAPLIVKDVLEMLSTVRKSGVTVLMVEQNFKAAIKIADRFYIMSKGQIVFEGDTASLLAAEEVRKNYLEV
jgi:branched-chain amino acid transport system ATP-binding protein